MLRGIERIHEEIARIKDFEQRYGLLSSIGVKILKTRDLFKIEGFIKAPDNSPYKNGIFRFAINLDHNYPDSSPNLSIKTPFFHTECSQEGQCCISFLKNWKRENKIVEILSVLYEFFVYQTHSGFSNEATALFRSDISKFNEKCQEYVKQYNENTKINSYSKEDFLIQENSGIERKLSVSEIIVVNIHDSISKILEIERSFFNKPIILFLKEYMVLRDDFAIIVGQKVFDSTVTLGECFIISPIIFIIPLLPEFSHYIRLKNK